MREFLTHPLFNITLGCSVILWVGLAIATRISKTPARAHGALVLALVGAVLFPIFYLSVCWADWGLLEPLPEDLTFTSLTRLDSDVKPQEGFLVPVQPAPEKSALLSSPGPSVNTPPEVLIAGPLSPEIPSPSEALVPPRSFPEKKKLKALGQRPTELARFPAFCLGLSLAVSRILVFFNRGFLGWFNPKPVCHLQPGRGGQKLPGSQSCNSETCQRDWTHLGSETGRA